MKSYVLTSLFVIGLAAPAWGAAEGKYFVTVDTVGNCSVAEGKPSAGQEALGESGGYASQEEARKFLESIRNDEAKCKGVVE